MCSLTRALPAVTYSLYAFSTVNPRFQAFLMPVSYVGAVDVCAFRGVPRLTGLSLFITCKLTLSVMPSFYSFFASGTARLAENSTYGLGVYYFFAATVLR